MYGVFMRFAPVVMAVSCDEAFLELAEGTDAEAAMSEVSGLAGVLAVAGCCPALVY